MQPHCCCRGRMEEKVDRIYERLLVLRCQTGDEAAFAELVGRYHARLRRFLRRMLDNDDHAAADTLQDVWIDVFRSVGKLRDAGAFAPWLFRVARDRAYRVLRRRGIAPDAIGEMNDVAAASAEAECRLLLSEDLEEGFTWRGVTVTNPFAPTLHPLLASLLRAREK